MPAGTDCPRITTFLMASRSIVMFMACRTRLSAKGLRPLMSDDLSSGELTSMPKKMVRFSGPKLTLRPGVFSSRSMSCTGTSCTKSTSPDSSAAMRVASDLMVRYVISVTPSGNCPLPQ